MKEVKFAIIGHGFIGHEHERVLLQTENARLVGVSDRDRSMLDDVAEGVKRYGSNEALFADPEVDVVIIAANNNQHHDLVTRSAEAGKDIICEKPLALNSEELDDMIRVTRKCNVKFTVHQQRRMDHDFRVMKEIYDQKSLGDVYMLKSSLYGYNGNMHDWHVYASEGGGMLYDWGVHLIDQILWMMPDAKILSVFADVRNIINAEVDDYFKILLRFDNHVMAEIELGTYVLSDKIDGRWFERHWIMSGNKGTAYTDGFSPLGKIVRTSRLLTNVSGVKPLGSAGPTRSFGPPKEGVIVTEPLPQVEALQQDDVYYSNYIRAWNGEGDFLVKTPEVQRVMRVMEAARKSAQVGSSVVFE